MPLTLIIAVVLIAHGIGHSLGYAPVFGWARTPGWSGESWLLTAATGPTLTNVLSVALWTVAIVTFVAAGLGILGLAVPVAWIRPLAVVGAVVSMLGVVLFWDAFPALTSKVGALAVDAVVLWAVFIGHWPSNDIVPG